MPRMFTHIKLSFAAIGGALRRSAVALTMLSAIATAMPAHGEVYVSSGSADADTLRGVTLDEVTVRRGREHYSKRNNPAVDFVNRIRNARKLGDPRRHPFYSYRKYEKIAIGINNFNVNPTDTVPKGRFGFLREHVDTSDVTGLPILPLSVKEKVSDIVYRRDPEAEKQIVQGRRQVGVDEFADLANVQTVVEDVFREVDLYQDNIPLMRNRFVSPLSAIGPDFYRYYLTDTAMVDGVKCVVLSFAPRNPATFGFLGRLYVEEGDTTMFVRKVDMGVSPTINLNFVDRLRVLQTFRKAPDGSRLKTLDDLNVDFSVLPGMPEIYARRTSAYDGHTFDTPSEEYAALLDSEGSVFEVGGVAERDSLYWADARRVRTGYNERRIDELMMRLRAVPLYRYCETALRIFVKGYVGTAKKDSKFNIGPLNTFVSYNSVEGLRLRAGGVTTANLSPHLFARGYAAYGFRDHRWKYNAELEYSFNRKKYHASEFPVHSITAQQRFDTDQLGQRYLFTNADNMFLALKRGDNHLIAYRRDTRLKYKIELKNNFSFALDAGLKRMEGGPWMQFVRPDGAVLGHYNQLELSATLRYAPGEKFMQTTSERISVNRDAPVVQLSHLYIPKGVWGAPWGVNRTEFSVEKRLWLSAFGYVDVMAKVGHVWSKSAFPDLSYPNANLSYTIQRESFSLLNPLEFIADTYGEWYVTYRANGLLLDRIPLIKKLKLREVVGFRGWIGRLSRRNRPQAGTADGSLLLFPEGGAVADMHGTPYMEITGGLDNIFRILRVECVWRLTYRDVPASERFGVRAALHFTF